MAESYEGGEAATGWVRRGRAQSWIPPRGDPLRKALQETAGERSRLDIGCAISHGAFQVAYPDDGVLLLDTSKPEGTLVYFEARLFRMLQAIGSPMAIDIDAYLAPLADRHEIPKALVPGGSQP